MKKIIPYGRQFIDQQDIISVTQSLMKDKITTGLLVDKFEKEINKYLKCKYSVTCNSGTSSIYLALQSIQLKKNDIIIMPAINFIASYNVAKLFGAKVYVADVDSESGQMRPKDVINCCKKFKLKKVKALILMYHGGYPENAEKFRKFRKKLGCYIIEDACHAFGSEYRINKINYKVGSCKHSDISTFSFHAVKSITTGEGGVVTTNSKKIYNKIKELRSIGIKRNFKHWDYDVVEYGLNFRLSDIQCALGISQLKKINLFLNKRKEIALKYKKDLKEIKNISLINHQPKYKSSYHLFFLKINNFNLKKKENFIKFMLNKKILLQYHYIPIYKFKIFKDKYYGANANKFYNTTISLPIYYSLKKKEHNYIIHSIKNFFNR